MNLFQKRLPSFVNFYVNFPKQSFVGLKNEVVVSLQKFKSPKKYYEQLLKEVPLTPKGLLILQPSYLQTLLSKCQNEKDIEVAVTAYYNFLGHQVEFPHGDIDKLIKKAVECGNPQATHDIIENHHYLMYFPHPDVLARMMKFYEQTRDLENAKKLFHIVLLRQLIKTNEDYFSQVVFVGEEMQDERFMFDAFHEGKKRGQNVSQKAFSALIKICYKNKSPHGAHVLFKAIDKYEVTPEEWIKLSATRMCNLNDAVFIFEKFAEKQFTVAPGKYLLPDNEVIKNFFNDIYARLHGRSAITKRFVNALNTIREKHGETAWSAKLEQYRQEAERTAPERKPATPPKEEEAKTEEVKAE